MIGTRDFKSSDSEGRLERIPFNHDGKAGSVLLLGADVPDGSWRVGGGGGRERGRMRKARKRRHGD